jgi:hypothetical protein
VWVLNNQQLASTLIMYFRLMQNDTVGRLEGSIKRLKDLTHPSDSARLLQECLTGWVATYKEARDMNLDSAVERYDSLIVNDALDQVDTSNDELVLLSAARVLAEELTSFLKSLNSTALKFPSAAKEAWLETSNGFLHNSGSLRSAALRLASAEEQRRQASELLESARESARDARRAAGSAGEASLASWFQEYGKNEHIASWAFRSLAFTGLIGTAALAYWFFLQSEIRELGVTSLALRSAIVLAVAAISTYAIRLAGQHRQQGNWAKSIAVQLNSFAAFLEPLESSSTRDVIYQQFAARVLGSPPHSNRNSAEPPLQVSAQDLAVLVARSQNTN